MVRSAISSAASASRIPARRRLAAAIRDTLAIPGNPPRSPPGPDDGLVGRLGAREAERRMRPVRAELARAFAEHRPAGEGTLLDCLAGAEPPLEAAAAVDELMPVLMAAQEPTAATLIAVLQRIGGDRRLAERCRDGGDGDEPWRDAVHREVLRPRPPALTGARQCLGQGLAEAQLRAALPAILDRRDLRPAWPRPRSRCCGPRSSCPTGAR